MKKFPLRAAAGGVCALAPALLGTVGAESARKQAQ